MLYSEIVIKTGIKSLVTQPTRGNSYLDRVYVSEHEYEDIKVSKAARLIHGLGSRDHVAPSLRDLHWLPLEQRINFKLCSLMHLIDTGHSPHYLQDLV